MYSDMVSYYNSLAMFPQPSRPQPPTNSAIYSSYAYNQYQHDQNSNLQLYPGFTSDFGAPGPAWSPAHWPSQFPGTCRNYEWNVEAGGHPPPTTTPSSEAGLHSPSSPQYSTAVSRAEQAPGSPSPSDYTVPAIHYKPSLSPPPGPVLHYKTEPTSTSDLGLPTSPSVSTGGPPNISIGSSLEEDCPSPSPLSSRPQPARSPFEWMKKPPHPSPPSSGDPNGKI